MNKVIKLNNEEITLRLTTLAVEKIEEHYNMSFEDIFKKENKSTFRAKNINYIIWALSGTDTPEEEFKKSLQEYTYEQCMDFIIEVLFDKDPNEIRQIATEKVTEIESSNLPQDIK